MPRAVTTKAQLSAALEALDQEHRRVQQALHEQDHLYSLLVEHSLGLMCIHDLDGVLLAINPAAAESPGYRPADGLGRNLRDFLAPSVRGLFPEYLDRIRRQPTDSGLLRLLARDGRERVWAYRNVRHDEPGRPTHVLGHALDITERVAAEQALRESEERFRLIAEHARDLICLLDPEGRCIYLSPACEIILGYSLATLPGMNLLDLVHPEDRAGMPDWHNMALHEFRMRCADGRWIWLAGSTAPFSWKGVPHVVGIARDITERRQAEDERARRLAQEQMLARELEARAQVEEALRLRDEILALATHDLRAPLTNVLGRTELVQRQARQGKVLDGSWLDAQMQSLRASAMRMLALIDEIGDVARLQTGQQLDLHVETLELRALVCAVAEEYAGVHGAERVTVAAPPDAILVHGDQSRLSRALQNLVDNAVRYSARGSPVEVRVERAEQAALITVRDRGAGIPQDELPRLFTRFFRGSAAAGTPGSGLGLAGAKLIVEQHGGELSITSAVGEGTTVTVRLPLGPA